MLIDNGQQYRAIFREVVEDCIIGKITKEQALMLLESRYNAELEKIQINEKNNPDVFHIRDRNGKLFSIQKNVKPVNKDTGKRMDLFDLYKEHIAEFNDCFNDNKAEIEAMPDKQNPELGKLIQNELISKMIEKGILLKNGKTPSKSLNDVACFFVVNNQPLSTKVLKDLGLIKPNGEPYSDSAYKKAIDIAHTH
jgi:hypothetical protein